MGDYYIELSFDAVDVIAIGRGCYVIHNGHKFEIMTNVTPDYANGGYRYTLRFESQQSQMKRCKVFWREGENLEVSFSDTATLSSLGKIIVDNVNAFLGSNNWVMGSVPQGLETTLKTVSFNGDYCWDAVSNIAEVFGVEWWTEETDGKVRLCFGKLENGDAVEFRRGDIVTSIPSKKGNSAEYGTRFYVFGSTKNLPSDYGSTAEGGVVSHIIENRLHLPNGQQYIDAWENIAQEDIVEQVVFFDDIYPTNVETITSTTWTTEIIDNDTRKVYTVYCENTPFTLDNIIEGEQIQANFTSGDLIGQTFNIEINGSAFDKKFKIIPNIYGEGVEGALPNDSLYPKAGDKFILIGVQLPNERIKEAERELLKVGTEYAQKNSSDTDVYDCPTNVVYCHNNDCNYDLGQRVILVGEQFGEGRASRIQAYSKKLYDEYQATYTVGDNSAYSRLASLEKAIQKSEYGERVGLEANLIRSKSDNTAPTDHNTYSALAIEKYFLSKLRGGTVNGHTDFAKGISLYGIKIAYDPETKTFFLDGNLAISGDMAIRAMLGDLDVPTIMDALVTDNENLKVIDGVLTFVGKTGEGGGGLDYTQLAKYLTDNGYATEGWVEEQNFVQEDDTIDLANRLVEEDLADLNNGTAGRLFTMTSGYGSTDGNKPTAEWVTGITLRVANNNAFRKQIAIAPTNAGTMYFRREDGGVWGAWKTILDSSNYLYYALPISGGAIKADGTIELSRSGDDRKTKVVSNGIICNAPSSASWGAGLYMQNQSGGSLGAAAAAFGSGGSLTYYYYGGEYNSPKMVILPNGDAGFGTTAPTGRVQINHSAFDNGLILNRTAANSGAGIKFLANGSKLGTVGINGTKTFEVAGDSGIVFSVDVTTGNTVAAGGVTARSTSDKRLKKNFEDINATEVLMSLGKVQSFEYVDSEVEANPIYKGKHIGLVYQNVKGSALDKMCQEREDGYGALNYLDTSFISLLAGVCQEQAEMIKELKREVEQLKEKVDLLERRG